MRFDLVVNTLVAHALTTGRVQVFTPAAWRPLIHVADVADAITSVVQAPAATVGTQVFNVGSADNWQLADVARLVAGICGPSVQVDINPVDGDARDYRITTSKLAAATGDLAPNCATGSRNWPTPVGRGPDGHPARGGPALPDPETREHPAISGPLNARGHDSFECPGSTAPCRGRWNCSRPWAVNWSGVCRR
jgi:hypothetical protein